MKAYMQGPFITESLALEAMLRATTSRGHAGVLGHVEMVNVETGERRPWIAEANVESGLVSARLTEDGTDLIEAFRDYWEGIAQAFRDEDEDGDLEEEEVDLDRELFDRIEDDLLSAWKAGWRLDAISIITARGRSQWSDKAPWIAYDGEDYDGWRNDHYWLLPNQYLRTWQEGTPGK